MKKLSLAVVLLAAAQAMAFPLVDRTMGPTPFYAERPALASRGDEGLAVWREADEIRAVRVGRNGQPLDAAALRIGRADFVAAPAVASDGQDYLVAWVAESALSIAFVRDGRTVETITSTAVGTLSRPELVWGGTGYVAMVRDSDTIRVLAVDRRGSVTGEAVAVSAAQGIGDATLAASRSVVALLWVDPVSSNVARVDVSAERIRSGAVGTQTNAAGIVTGIQRPRTVAAAGNGNGFLAVWTDSTGPSATDARRLIYRALSAAADPMGDRGEMPVEPRVEERPTVSWNGSSFTLVWTVSPDRNRAVMSLRIGADGKPLDAVPKIIAGTGQEIYDASASALIGGNTVVVFRTLGSQSLLHASSEVVALALTPALALAGDAGGTVLSRRLPDEKAAGSAWAGDHWVAVWSERRDVDRIAVGRITPEGQRLDPAGILLDPVPSVRRSQSDAAIASSGAKSLAVWIDQVAWNDAMLRGAIIDGGRGPLQPRPITISFDATNYSAPSVAWNGEAYVVAWRTKARYIAAVRISRTGDVLDPVPIMLTEAHSGIDPGDASPLLAAHGDELLLVWQRGTAVSTGTGMVPNVFYDLLAQRFNRSLTPVGSSRLLSFGAEQGVSADLPVVAAGPDGWLVSWSQSTYNPYGRPKATLVAVLLDAAADKGRVLLLGDVDPYQGRAAAWNGGAFLLAQERTLFTISSDARVVSRTPLAFQAPYVAQSLEGRGPSPLLLVTSPDLDESTPDEAFLLTPPRRRSTTR
ncbi:MAG TPA: hypothetical protein VJ276_06575 [Thermoanaerobaculia bacterium]|nr:hypothetical protein [Thermoanaerobaculia bacterium]